MIEDYFRPADIDLSIYEEGDDSLFHIANIYSVKGKFPQVNGHKIAIFGVNENRGSHLKQSKECGADSVRSKFYQLKTHASSIGIIDFGNLVQGETLEDTYVAIATVVSELLPLKVIPVIIGGSQDLTLGHYGGYKKLEQIINIVSIDPSFDLGKPENEITSESYLGRIILEQPNYLFNYTNIGYQTYFVGQENIQLMRNLYFDAYRLGQVQTDIKEVEPIMRGADLITFDVSAIRQSESPGSSKASPNGFYGEEACQMMIYAGASDKCNGLGIYEFNVTKDRDEQTAHLIAQMIWCFVEGVTNRKIEMPLINTGSYITYRVPVQNIDQEITFLKSKKSDRWWIKLPIDPVKNRYASHHLMPCSYKDYQQACNNEVPERWWSSLQKLS
jgi:arginase family enzyme